MLSHFISSSSSSTDLSKMYISSIFPTKLLGYYFGSSFKFLLLEGGFLSEPSVGPSGLTGLSGPFGLSGTPGPGST